ncbi:hypothetical protein [Anaerobaca lacustris]|uniref:Uncharacterized protein n=1 Tax=Anaerobaca lacustris TaxID=3044600 RepID=A0AAW6U1P8_9BACT|nr:hypothetical protein [Sedimentisphaerales bacterium M17dextr]
MVRRGKIVLSVIAALAVAGLAYADVPPAPPDLVGHIETETTPVDLSCGELARALGLPSALDVDALSVAFVPPAVVEAEPAAQGHAVVVLAERNDSLTLCLYALMGLGLCKSGPWVKRFSIGIIPEWYHSGAPQQIGHSHAVGPDAYCHAAVCFVQPDSPAERLMPHYHQGTIPSLVRQSQAILPVDAPRGPPTCS